MPLPARLLPAVLALALAGSLPASATAADDERPGDDDVVTTTRTTDPDDTPGPYDLAVVEHRVRQLSPPRGAVRVRWTIRTHKPFQASSLDSRRRRFTVELDTDGERGAERNVRLVRRDGRVVAEVVSNATREVLRTLPTGRPDPRTLTFAGWKGQVGARRYFWYAYYHHRDSGPCGRGDGFPKICQDDAPEDGWIRMDRPAWPAVG